MASHLYVYHHEVSWHDIAASTALLSSLRGTLADMAKEINMMETATNKMLGGHFCS